MTITVAVCTGGRESLVETVRSIGRQSRPPEKLLVIDQSGSGKGKLAVEAAAYPFSVEVVDQDVKGLSHARNEALRRVDTDWLFFTDDDCLAAVELVDQVHKVSERYPEASFIAGSCIRPLYYNPETHHAPGVCIGREVELNQATVVTEQVFMGACLAFRKALLEAVGEFDAYLGAGTEWPSGEEYDYVLRAILKGFKGRSSARLVVFHEYGARERPPGGIEANYVGNAVVLWKMRQMGSQAGIEMAQRIYPAGRRRALIAKLTLGRKYADQLRMLERCQELERRLDREFVVENELIRRR